MTTTFVRLVKPKEFSISIPCSRSVNLPKLLTQLFANTNQVSKFLNQMLWTKQLKKK